MKDKLVLLADRLDKLGLHKEAEAVDSILSRFAEEAKSPEKKIKDKYFDNKNDHFKGGKGERFDHCVDYFLEMNEKGLKKLHKTDKNGKPRTPKESAEALCSYINSRK